MFCKKECVFPVVISSEFRMRRHRDGNHQVDAPYFICSIRAVFDKKIWNDRKEIYLEANHIKELPKSFFRLTNLEKVSLECNDLQRITGDFASMEKLLELNLSRNHLHEINDTISCCVKLEIFDLSHNNIPRLPDRKSHKTQV